MGSGKTANLYVLPEYFCDSDYYSGNDSPEETDRRATAETQEEKWMYDGR